jgi:transcriptional regulator with XRE-family HTH domain
VRAKPPKTDAPFAEALSELKHERSLTFREMHEATQAADPTGRGLSGTHISRLCKGFEPPSSKTIVLIAKALGLSPQHFAEYRLAEARALLDERAPGGLRAALGQLKRLEPHLGTRRASAQPGRRTRRRSS